MVVSKGRSQPSWPVLLLLLCLGGIAGALIGELIQKLIPSLALLGKVQSVGVPQFTVDLHVFSLTFGFMLRLNLFALLGFLAAYLIYRKL
ncbi:MAG: DUF4321 domain-containing protein [Syntrophomonas sp.]